MVQLIYCFIASNDLSTFLLHYRTKARTKDAFLPLAFDHGKKYQGVTLPARLSADENKSNDDGWSLEEDWALQDQVPHYTIQSTTNRRSDAEVVTFWTQLKHSTPELCTRSEKELEERYQIICEEIKDTREKVGANTNANRNAKEIHECGPSPPLLSNWWIENKNGNDRHSDDFHSPLATLIMGGTLDNGSKIWFPLQCAGNLAGDPFMGDDFFTISTTTSFSNYVSIPGYAEASGGRIYELGSPHPNMMARTMMKNEETMHQYNIPFHDRVDVEPMTQKQLSNLDHNGSIKTIVTIGNDAKAWVLGIIAASAFSAFVAFGVGAGQTAGKILSSSSITTAHPAPPPPSTTIVRVVKSVDSNPTIVTAGATTTEVSQLSIEGQRARQELKVEREKTGLIRLQDKIKMDEAKLDDLRKEESRQDASKYGF